MSASDEGEALPLEVTRQIPERDTTVLRFFLAFLRARHLEDVPLLVAGGYVRDLLLSSRPDDLDVALCLHDVADPELRVETLLEEMPQFAVESPHLHVDDVRIVTIRSDETKSKLLDTVKLHLVVAEGGGGDGSERFEVDVMPTIGEETYEDDSRIPTRNQRGSVREDALRRDLTIGALLLRVQSAQDGDDGALEYRLIDYYGGVEDLQRGVLRSPYPRDADCGKLFRDIVQQSPTMEKMAHVLGLLPEKWSDGEALAQRLWWIKVLVEDPLRVVRVLRFAAKLDFSLHDAFWDVVPFAVKKLRDMVAGSRKLTEILKIANYSDVKLRAFISMSFGRRIAAVGTVYHGEIESATEFQDGVLAPSLFGGQDARGVAKFIPSIKSFDQEAFDRIVPEGLHAVQNEEALGLCLAAAVVASDYDGRGLEPTEQCQERLGCFSQCCDGLSCSNVTRYAGEHSLEAAHHLLSVVLGRKELQSPEDEAFGAIAGVSGDEFSLHVHIWIALRMAKMPLPGASTTPEHPDPTLGARASLTLACCAYFLRTDTTTGDGHLGGEEVDSLYSKYRQLLRGRPSVSGKALGGTEVVPIHLRSSFIARVQVVTRLLDYQGDIGSADELHEFLEGTKQGGIGLEERLRQVWWQQNAEGDWVLKPEFQGPGGGARKRRSQSSKKQKRDKARQKD